MKNAIYVWIAATALLLGACPKKGPIKPAPDPRRPKEIVVDNGDPMPKDCEPTNPRSLPPSVSYRERSIAESTNLAAEGFVLLRSAEERKLTKIEREEMVTEAVDKFITALTADPYNVHATYNLAAAYGRIRRPQCAVNLLERLVELRKLPSQKAEVEAKLDRLLGRGKYKRRMDPDFSEMRDMKMFRDVVKKFCPSLSASQPLDRCGR